MSQTNQKNQTRQKNRLTLTRLDEWEEPLRLDGFTVRENMSDDDMLAVLSAIIHHYESPMEKIINQYTRPGIHLALRNIEKLRLSNGIREMGSCTISRANDKICRITISRRLFFKGNENEIINVVCHEMLHAFLPAREGHGQAFKFLMDRLNKKLSLNIRVHSSRDSIQQSESLYNYKVTCTKCGAESYYIRAGSVVKYPRRYICSYCGSKSLKVERIITKNKQ